MSSRASILAAIKTNQPALLPLPEVENYVQPFNDFTEKFRSVLQAIGGHVYEAADTKAAIALLQSHFGSQGRMITLLQSFEPYATFYNIHEMPHLLENVDVAIITAEFCVAENGSVWVTDEFLPARVLPFICNHLVALVRKNEIVATMHDAYDMIGKEAYGFGVFIAGPSKTADIEQSLVLGAHGPKTMTVILMG